MFELLGMWVNGKNDKIRIMENNVISWINTNEKSTFSLNQNAISLTTLPMSLQNKNNNNRLAGEQSSLGMIQQGFQKIWWSNGECWIKMVDSNFDKEVITNFSFPFRNQKKKKKKNL